MPEKENEKELNFTKWAQHVDALSFFDSSDTAAKVFEEEVKKYSDIIEKYEIINPSTVRYARRMGNEIYKRFINGYTTCICVPTVILIYTSAEIFLKYVPSGRSRLIPLISGEYVEKTGKWGVAIAALSRIVNKRSYNLISKFNINAIVHRAVSKTYVIIPHVYNITFPRTAEDYSATAPPALFNGSYDLQGFIGKEMAVRYLFIPSIYGYLPVPFLLAENARFEALAQHLFCLKLCSEAEFKARMKPLPRKIVVGYPEARSLIDKFLSYLGLNVDVETEKYLNEILVLYPYDKIMKAVEDVVKDYARNGCRIWYIYYDSRKLFRRLLEKKEEGGKENG